MKSKIYQNPQIENYQQLKDDFFQGVLKKRSPESQYFITNIQDLIDKSEYELNQPFYEFDTQTLVSLIQSLNLLPSSITYVLTLIRQLYEAILGTNLISYNSIAGINKVTIKDCMKNDKLYFASYIQTEEEIDEWVKTTHAEFPLSKNYPEGFLYLYLMFIGADKKYMEDMPLEALDLQNRTITFIRDNHGNTKQQKPTLKYVVKYSKTIHQLFEQWILKRTECILGINRKTTVNITIHPGKLFFDNENFYKKQSYLRRMTKDRSFSDKFRYKKIKPKYLSRFAMIRFAKEIDENNNNIIRNFVNAGNIISNYNLNKAIMPKIKESPLSSNEIQGIWLEYMLYYKLYE